MIVLLMVALLAAVTSAGRDETSQHDVIAANLKFASDFYSSWHVNTRNQNFLFSSQTVHAALAILFPAARGLTRTVLKNALHLDSPEAAARGYRRLLRNLTIDDVDGSKMKMVNKLFIHPTIKSTYQYRNILESKFKSQVDNTIDLREDADHAVMLINDWIARETGGHIEHVMDAKDLLPTSSVVIVSALYLTGTWSNVFHGHTKTESFYNSYSRSKITVKMMHNEGIYQYKDDKALKAQVIKIPFNEDDLEMMIVLPRDRIQIESVEKRLVQRGLGISNMKEVFLKLSLPKFSLVNKMNMKRPLEGVGLGILFDRNECDLSNMGTSNETISVTTFIHKVVLDVHQTGAEGTAAAGRLMAVDKKSMKHFNANHPFLVVLMKGDAPLFYGKIVDPKFGTGH